MSKDSINVLVARLDERQQATDKVINEIKDNHLVHLKADITSLDSKVDALSKTTSKWAGGLAVLIVILTVGVPVLMKIIWK